MKPLPRLISGNSVEAKVNMSEGGESRKKGVSKKNPHIVVNKASRYRFWYTVVRKTFSNWEIDSLSGELQTSPRWVTLQLFWVTLQLFSFSSLEKYSPRLYLKTGGFTAMDLRLFTVYKI